MDIKKRLGGGAAISLFPVPTLSTDFGLGYNVFTATDEDNAYGDYQDIDSGMTIDVGVGVFF